MSFYILRYRYAVNKCSLQYFVSNTKECKEGCAEQNVKLLDDTQYLEEFYHFINSLIETTLHEDTL